MTQKAQPRIWVKKWIQDLFRVWSFRNPSNTDLLPVLETVLLFNIFETCDILFRILWQTES